MPTLLLFRCSALSRVCDGWISRRCLRRMCAGWFLRRAIIGTVFHDRILLAMGLGVDTLGSYSFAYGKAIGHGII